MKNNHSKIYWYNPNNQHYYIVRKTYDLLDDLILIKEWGRASRIGGSGFDFIDLVNDHLISEYH